MVSGRGLCYQPLPVGCLTAGPGGRWVVGGGHVHSESKALNRKYSRLMVSQNLTVYKYKSEYI